jgi:type III secretion apparatus needle protein
MATISTPPVDTAKTEKLVVDSVYYRMNTAVNSAGGELDTALTAAQTNPNDPVNMILMQKALANYTLALSVQSAVIKSIEETAKSITQKL